MSAEQREYWLQKLEQLKVSLGKSTTYRDLAAELKLTEGFLSHVRAKSREMPLGTKLKVLDLLGGEVTDEDFVMLLSPKTRSEAEGKALNVFDPEDGKELFPGFWVKAIEDVKKAFKVESDYALAKSLDVSPSMISAQKKGGDVLSSSAKLKILDKLAYTATRNLLLDVLPPKIRERVKDYDDLRFVARARKCKKS